MASNALQRYPIGLFLDLTLDRQLLAVCQAKCASMPGWRLQKARALANGFSNTCLPARVWSQSASPRSLRSVALNPHSQMSGLAELELGAPNGVQVSRRRKRASALLIFFENGQSCTSPGCNCRLSRRVHGAPQPAHAHSHEILRR